MIHEWLGSNDNFENMSNELTKEIRAVLAVDLYNGKQAITADKALKLMKIMISNKMSRLLTCALQ